MTITSGIAVLRRSTAALSPPALVGLVAAATAVVDWSTKALASVVLHARSIELAGVLTLRLGHNPGVAFGLGNRLPSAVIIALTAMVTAVLAVVAFRGFFPSPIAAGLVLGGAVGNLADRIIGGTVVDFLDLGWWPSFNLADVSLSIGVGLMFLLSLRGSEPQRPAPQTPTAG